MFLGLLKRLFGPKLFGPKMLADPYPFYARLRSAAPVYWVDQIGGWVLTRYARRATGRTSICAASSRSPSAFEARPDGASAMARAGSGEAGAAMCEANNFLDRLLRPR
jgi:hypothetical protein